MVRLRRSLLALALALADAGGAETPVGGRVLGPDGQGLEGLRVGLEPVHPDFERVATRLAGDVGPGPEVEATTDADGFFQLLAPRPGAWKVVVPVDGGDLVAREYLLRPLHEPVELPPVELRRASRLEVQVLDAAGEPVAARLGLYDRRRSTDGWRPRLRLAGTGDDGVARLPREPGEEPRLEIVAADHPLIVAGADDLDAAGGPAEIRLPAGVAGTVRALDPRGRPVAGAVVYQGGGVVPLGRTGDDGRLRLVVAKPADERPGVKLLTADGLRAHADLPFAPEGVKEVDVALEPLRRLRGRVIDRESRDPVAGALVWVRNGPVTETDDRGDYELRLFPSREATVQAVAEGYAMALERQRFAGADDEDGPTLALAPAAAVRGTVTDVDGNPVAGVVVRVEPLDADEWRRGQRWRRGQPDTHSTRDGRFFLLGLRPSVSYELHFRAPGYAPARHLVEGLAAFEHRAGVRVVLETGASGEGRVVDESGTPVAGAEVRLVPVVEGDRRRVSRSRIAGADEDGPSSAWTDAEGRFRLSNLAAGRYDLEVEAAGFAPAAVPGLAVVETEAVDLGTVVLAPGARVAGVVRDPQGAALAEAEVFVARQNVPLIVSREEPVAESDARGRFEVADLELEKAYRLVVGKTGYAFSAADVVAAEGATVEVVLRPAGAIAGRVRDADGPVAGAMVYLEPPLTRGIPAFHAPRPPAVSADDGTFRLESVEPGRAHLGVHAPGYQEYALRDLEVPAGGELSDVEIVLVRGATVTGTVTRRDGSPVVEARVFWSPAQGGSTQGGYVTSDSTDGEGRYRIEGLPTGPAVLGVQTGRNQHPSKNVEIGAGAQTVDLVVDGGFEVTGRVTDPAGRGVAGATLMLTSTNPERTQYTTTLGRVGTTGADGVFALNDLAAGHYLLTASKPGYADAMTAEPFEVAGPVAGIELELERGALLHGRVLGLEPHELADVVVEAMGGSSGMRTGVVDFAGEYTIANLGAGSWHVRAHAKGSGRLTTGRVTVEAGDSEVALDLEFESGFTVDGVVIAGGEPRPGAHVFASGPDGARAEGTTGLDGRFRLSHLPAGSYTLMVTTGNLADTRTLEVPAEREVEIVLAARRIAGHVLDDDGPLAGVVLRLERLDAEPGTFHTFGTHEGRTDSRGRFSLSVGEGVWRLVATRAGYGPAETTVDTRAGNHDDVVLRLSPTAGITFEVAAGAAAPAQVWYAVLDPSGRVVNRGVVPVSDGGTVRLSTVPAGTWDLLVQAGDSAVTRAPIVAPGHVGRVVLVPGGELRIRVPELTDEHAGSPYPDLQELARVRLTGPDGRPQYVLENVSATAPPWPVWRGETTIPRLAPGLWSFTVTHPDGRVWTGQAAVVAGETSEVVVP